MIVKINEEISYIYEADSFFSQKLLDSMKGLSTIDKVDICYSYYRLCKGYKGKQNIQLKIGNKNISIGKTFDKPTFFIEGEDILKRMNQIVLSYIKKGNQISGIR